MRENTAAGTKNGGSKRQNDRKKDSDLPYIIISLVIAAAVILGSLYLPAAFEKNFAKPLSELDGVSTGDHFYFGSWVQYSEEKEPIKWRVISVEDGKALVISDMLLDCRKFDTASGAWAASTLRYWLNNGFFTEAFSESEKERIALASNADTGTEDRVFCLSADETKRYLVSEGQRLASPTAHATERGAYLNEGFLFRSTLNTGWWWLRSPGSADTIALTVNASGSISGVRANTAGGCVRPAMWILLD